MTKKIQYIEQEIIDQYLHDENETRPWIIGFSGGKDSTVVLQLVWNALLKIDNDKRIRDVHVVCNDTLVENPIIEQYVNEILFKIQTVKENKLKYYKYKLTNVRVNGSKKNGISPHKPILLLSIISNKFEEEKQSQYSIQK